MTTLAQVEQLLLEMVNRARLDPAGEAARLGLSGINEGLAAGTISTAPKQVLAGSNLLSNAAEGHSNAMQASRVLEDEPGPNQRNGHTQAGDGTPGQRIAAAGYSQNQLPFWRDENIGVQATSQALTQDQIETLTKAVHDSLFVDTFDSGRGHRLAMMDDNMREAGMGAITGTFKGFNAVIVTQNFGVSGTQSFLTGAVYNDTDGDHFYGLGEAVQGVTVSVANAGGGAVGGDTTGSGGGFSVGVPGGAYTVTFSGGGLASAVSATVEAGSRNAKIDLVNGGEINSSASTTLGAGATGLRLLGIADVNGTGNTAANALTGNKGANILEGRGGDDTLDGAAGDDTAVFSGLQSQYQVTILSGTSARITDLRGGASDGSDVISNIEHVRFADVTVNFGDLRTTSTNAPPVVSVADHSLQVGQTAQLQAWLTYSDANGQAATQYQIIDDGAAANSGYLSTSGNAHVAAGSVITLSAAQLAGVVVHAGDVAGSEAFRVRAFDGQDWSAWDQFTLTTKAANAAPVVSAGNHTIKVNAAQAMQSWFTAADANGDTITKYAFWDGGADANSGYFSTSASAHHPAQTSIIVNAADLGSVVYHGGAAAGSESLFVAAYDGQAWGAWKSFTAATVANATPVVTATDRSLQVNATQQVKTWFTASDANGDAITKYAFWDAGTDATSGFFSSSASAHHAAGKSIIVDAADLGSVAYHGGSFGGAETLFIAAYDGQAWGGWTKLTATTVNAAPQVSADDRSLHINEWAKVGNWFTASDADGHAITKYDFWDGGTATTSGFFWTPDNAHQPSGAHIIVDAANVGDVWVRGGQVGGSETLFVRAFDGQTWGAWDSLKLTTVNEAPEITTADQALYLGQQAHVADWFQATDPDGSALTQFRFWDGNGDAAGGYLSTATNAHAPAATAITVNAADLDKVIYHAGQTGGTETLWVQAFDGQAWSEWTPWNVTTRTDGVFTGGAGADTIMGGAANDTISGGLGADKLSGGAGVDTLSYETMTGAVTVNLATNTVSGAAGSQAAGDVISGFENVTGGAGNDSLTGDANANTLRGWAGDDRLTGGGGDDRLFGGLGADTLSGGEGDDTLSGGGGADNLSGGNGVDTLSYKGLTTAVAVNLGTNTVFAAAGTEAAGDTISGFQNVVGGSGNDTLVGDSGANWLQGGAGADRLNGAGGADFLTGEGGADTFVFKAGFGHDVVTDFTVGQDSLEFGKTVFADFQALIAASQDDGLGNVLITKDVDTSVLLQDVSLADLKAHQPDFLFV